jgi:hypothetical protein
VVFSRNRGHGYQEIYSLNDLRKGSNLRSGDGLYLSTLDVLLASSNLQLTMPLHS